MATRIKYKRRRKKRHYKTGVHNSPKCSSPIKYRSGWELAICIYIDEDPNVIEYSYEPFKIPYISNKKCAKIRNYIPDFLITYKDGHKILAEVKRQDKLNDLIVKKKIEAGKQWAAQQKNITYQLWTDNMILPLLKLQKLKKKKKKLWVHSHNNFKHFLFC